ncbi:hypothetical protein [Xanthomonas citri]|uniref:hypothetical protein n=1 Tax=Xanthomonas citri TaxID=346 RepID=UPI001F1F8C02|nr:hypothetical protein [Xanthomonas citri]
MSNYQQIHGFTAAGDERFRTFIAAHFAENPFIAAHYHGDPEEARRDCLSVLEDNLNGAGGPLTWGLLSPSSPGDLPTASRWTSMNSSSRTWTTATKTTPTPPPRRPREAPCSSP